MLGNCSHQWNLDSPLSCGQQWWSILVLLTYQQQPLIHRLLIPAPSTIPAAYVWPPALVLLDLWCYSYYLASTRKVTVLMYPNEYGLLDPWWRHQMETLSALLSHCVGHRWIPLTNASDAEHWSFLWSTREQTLEQTIVRLVIWDAIALIMTLL